MKWIVFKSNERMTMRWLKLKIEITNEMTLNKISNEIRKVIRWVKYWMELRMTALMLITKVIKDDDFNINNGSNNKSN